MILCDTGPIVAIINDSDAHHEKCLSCFDRAKNQTLATTTACLAEAFYLLGRKIGFNAQDSLHEMLANNTLGWLEIIDSDWHRIREMMAQYRDLPMDFPDATLVVLAERLNVSTIFSLDSDFRVYRPNHCDYFDILP